jgi:hypothetical protein
MIWAADPRGDPAPHDWAFQYASQQHRSQQALLQTEYQTELLKSGEVEGFDNMPDLIFSNPRDPTAKALRLISEAALANKQAQSPSQRTTGPLLNSSRLLERMALPLKKEKETVEADHLAEVQIIQEAEALIRDIKAGKM